MHSIEYDILQYSRQTPSKVAIKSGKNEATYEQLIARIWAAKEKLQQIPGYQVGNTLILAAGKQIEFIYVYFGAHLAGLTVSPIDAETNPTRLDLTKWI